MAQLFTFQDSSLPPVEQVGGKGLSLMYAHNKGFEVPPAAVLSTAFFHPWIDQLKATSEWKAFAQANDAGKAAAATAVKKCSRTLTLVDEQQQTLAKVRTYLRSEGISLVAVRSSSPEEDREGASFSGIYESVLGVTDRCLEDAIKTCFVSALDRQVVLYKLQRGYDPLDPEIAVIIQKQVASETSGVAFSLNPVTNCYDDCVINANFGLGETVVDGTVTPDQFTVDKVHGKILEKVAAHKDVAHHLTPGGGVETRTPADPLAFCLTDDQVLAITSLTSRIEAEYGKPTDIEWTYEAGRLYLLQARPITGYIQLPPEMITRPGQRKTLYQDGLLTEQGLVESLSPLGEGMLGLLRKASIMALGGGGDDTLSDREKGLGLMAGGRVYADVGRLVKLSGRTNVIKGARMPDALGADILTTLDLNPYVKGLHLPKGMLWRFVKMGVKGLPRYLRMGSRIRAASTQPSKYLEFFLEKNVELERDLEAEYAKHEPIGVFSRVALEIFARWLFTVSTPTLTAAELARSRIRKSFKNEPRLLQDQIVYLEQALPGNVTIEMGLHLHDLSQFPDLRRTATAAEFLQQLDQRQLSARFMETWNLFMQRYGHRCPREIDIATPRYRERPGEVFMLLKTMSSCSDPKETPREVFERGVKRREDTLQCLVDVLEEQHQGNRKVKRLQKRYKVIETFKGYREIHKYYLVVTIDYIRRRVLSLATQWVDAGRLDTVEQVFDLRLEEVVHAERDPDLDLRPLISANTAYYGPFKNQVNPPVLIDSRGFIPSPPRTAAGQNEFSGTPVSPGTVKGPVKILSRPDEKPLLPGEILVTRATDPGWTALFLNARGVLLETGGTLQHGASVARESCKPCIVGLNNIATMLNDGQVVEMNGSTGTITIQ